MAVLFAPPGLENDAMKHLPAKVAINPASFVAPTQRCSERPRRQHRQQQQQQLQPTGTCITSGEWVNAVLATASYLNAEGLKEALAILDRALDNVQHIKALDGIISSTYIAGGIFPTMPHLETATHMKAQICEQQQILLGQLHHLRATSPVAGPAQALSAAAATCILEHMYSSQNSAVQPMQQQPHLGGGEQQRAPPPQWERQRPQQERQQPQQAPDVGEFDSVARPVSCRVQTLSTSLQLLSNEDPSCLFIVRRINKLGFKAARKLKKHFQGFGTVVRVLVAHSTVRQHGDPQCHPRRRPSSLGFVHMATAEAVRAILAMGEEQDVDGSLILAQRFERQHAGALQDEVAAESDELEETNKAEQSWERQQSVLSAATTATSASFEGRE